MSSKISQKEYIKKYLSGDKKKKKKDKKPKVKATVKIIDDDVHVNNDLEIDEELLLTGEDAPQIVGIINASGEPPKSKWKSISSNTEEQKVDDDPWGKKADPICKRDSSPKRDIDEFSFRKPRRISSIQSPPRTKTEKSQHLRHNSPSEKRSRWKSPPRKADTRSDLSPPRKRSPTRSRKNADQSPPRKRSPSNRNQSPSRKRRNSDQSPPRRRAIISKNQFESSQTNIKRENSSDQSPPRRSGGRSKVHADQSSPRRRRNSDQSPPRRQKNSDQSPPRRNTLKTSDRFESSSRDQSRPRSISSKNPFKASIKMNNSPPPNSQNNRYSDSPPPTHKSLSSKMTKTLDGKRAGLQDAQTLKNETEERRRNEDRMYSKMSKEISGRDAEVQIRQSSYRRHRKYVEEDPEVQRKKAEHEEKKKELYSRWNKGVKQIEEIHAKISDDQYEGSKPLARYSNDADLEEMLRQKERDDDPMLEYIRSKKKEQQVAANIPVMPKYKGLCPENRFNILPGYRWDGVDRSNGYEKKWFDVQSAKEAMAEEAYLYSVEDL